MIIFKLDFPYKIISIQLKQKTFFDIPLIFLLILQLMLLENILKFKKVNLNYNNIHDWIKLDRGIWKSSLFLCTTTFIIPTELLYILQAFIYFHLNFQYTLYLDFLIYSTNYNFLDVQNLNGRDVFNNFQFHKICLSFTVQPVNKTYRFLLFLYIDSRTMC